MDSIEQPLDASYASLSTQILQSSRETSDTILATLRSEMEAMGGTLRSEISGLRGEMAAMGVSLRDEMKALRAITVYRFEKVETALADGLDGIRRFMKVLHEDTLSRIALLGEGRRPS